MRQGLKLNDPNVQFTKCHSTFDLDAEFKTKTGTVVLRVVGIYNSATGKYHRYVTTLSERDWAPEELATLSGVPATSDEIGPWVWPDPWAVALVAAPDRPERGACDQSECAGRER